MPTSLESGGVRFPDNTLQGTAAVAGGGAETKIYTSPATWTKPANLKAVKVSVMGGGGGGSGARGSLTAGGGGTGGIAISYIIPAPSIPGPVSVTVGAGGAGGPRPGSPNRTTAGGTGGTSSFGSFISATGGQGGRPVTSPGAVNVYLANGGVGTVSGPPAIVSRAFICKGASTVNPRNGAEPPNEIPSGTLKTFRQGGTMNFFGRANDPSIPRAVTPTAPGTRNGTAASSIGCGGAGAVATNPQPRSGGAGFHGIVIVEEFY